jgi:hypothetical protein
MAMQGREERKRTEGCIFSTLVTVAAFAGLDWTTFKVSLTLYIMGGRLLFKEENVRFS